MLIKVMLSEVLPDPSTLMSGDEGKVMVKSNTVAFYRTMPYPTSDLTGKKEIFAINCIKFPNNFFFIRIVDSKVSR